jgi:predicted NUDIX family phosphoesterase
MVVRRDTLFAKDYFEGFKPAPGTDFENIILKDFSYLERGIAEGDPNYKQPISYCMIVNPDLRKAFLYQRSLADHKYYEKRLQGRWSWGLGGHIEKIDAVNGRNPLHSSLLRELSEEVQLQVQGEPQLLGFINYDSDKVGQVHFGVLYLLETDSEKVMIRDPEIGQGRLATLQEIESISLSPEYVVEDWSKISLPPLRSYLGKIKTA